MKKIVLALGMLLSASLTVAQSYPQKPVKIVLSIGVGAQPDVMARKMAEVLTEKWKVPVIVENKPGGAGIIGLNYINNEPADGYTLGVFEGGTVIAYQSLYKNSEPINRLEALMPLTDTHMLLTTSTQIATFNDLKKEIAKNSSYGSWNIGSVAHVLGAQFGSIYSNNAQHVPYKDFGVWQADISTRTTAYGFGSYGTTRGMIQGGKNHWLAIASPHRDPKYPNIPTVKELTGQDVYSLISWCAFYISKDAPASVKVQIEKDLREAATDPRVQEAMSKLDVIPLNKMSKTDFEKKVNKDYQQYNKLIKQYNISIQNN